MNRKAIWKLSSQSNCKNKLHKIINNLLRRYYPGYNPNIDPPCYMNMNRPVKFRLANYLASGHVFINHADDKKAIYNAFVDIIGIGEKLREHRSICGSTYCEAVHQWGSHKYCKVADTSNNKPLRSIPHEKRKLSEIFQITHRG